VYHDACCPDCAGDVVTDLIFTDLAGDMPPMPEHERIEEGQPCPNGCTGGVMVFPPVEGCGCLTNPPCQACVENDVVCSVCGWSNDDALADALCNHCTKRSWCMPGYSSEQLDQGVTLGAVPGSPEQCGQFQEGVGNPWI